MGSAKTENRLLNGLAASPGVAIGLARVTDRSRVAVAETAIEPDAVADEIARYREALTRTRSDLLNLKEKLAAERGHEHLYVIDTHLLMLDDPMLTDETERVIAMSLINAEAAVKKTLQTFHSFFSTIEDEYLRERSSDVEIVVERILRHMVGKEQESLDAIDGKVVIVAHDLSPADILQIDKDKVIGFITDLGGKTSHSAILARALEIPAVIGLENVTAVVATGDHLVVDGSSGTVVVNPDQETFRDYLRRKQYFEYVEQELSKLRELPAETVDGQRVRLMGNVEFAEEIEALKGHGGEGIGLYRTEMLFMNRAALPTEEEQYQAYSTIVKAMAPAPVTIRTLDVGGDKFVPDLNLDDEMNPALGLRAIRLSLRHPETLRPQLRAILRASAHGPVRIFFPMISGIGEVRAVKRILAEVAEELRQEGIPFDGRIPVGIMIEVPSAVIIADLLAREVDFFSVGTNDLIQYSLAIDRTNEHLSHLYEPLHPAVLRSLKLVADAAHAAGIDVCMCGEMAGDPTYLPILLGLGFDELSMNAPSIPRVKRMLRRCARVDAERLTATALTFASTAEVEAFLNGEIAARFADSFD